MEEIHSSPGTAPQQVASGPPPITTADDLIDALSQATAGDTIALLSNCRGSEIHNEILHDESAAFPIERMYPESDHAPVVATFDF